MIQKTILFLHSPALMNSLNLAILLGIPDKIIPSDCQLALHELTCLKLII